MNTITKRFSMLVKLAVCLALAFGFAAEIKAQDAKADGTWSWTTPGRNGGPDRKMTLKLKTEGDKLAGKLSFPGRDNTPVETEIKDGKVKGDEVTFTVVREFNGNKMTSKYNGKISGDTLKGKIEFDRNGETQSRDWTAKKEKETEKK